VRPSSRRRHRQRRCCCRLLVPPFPHTHTPQPVMRPTSITHAQNRQNARRQAVDRARRAWAADWSGWGRWALSGVVCKRVKARGDHPPPPPPHTPPPGQQQQPPSRHPELLALRHAVGHDQDGGGPGEGARGGRAAAGGAPPAAGGGDERAGACLMCRRGRHGHGHMNSPINVYCTPAPGPASPLTHLTPSFLHHILNSAGLRGRSPSRTWPDRSTASGRRSWSNCPRRPGRTWSWRRAWASSVTVRVDWFRHGGEWGDVVGGWIDRSVGRTAGCLDDKFRSETTCDKPLKTLDVTCKFVNTHRGGPRGRRARLPPLCRRGRHRLGRWCVRAHGC
jgi:hypothetical protein